MTAEVGVQMHSAVTHSTIASRYKPLSWPLSWKAKMEVELKWYALIDLGIREELVAICAERFLLVEQQQQWWALLM